MPIVPASFALPCSPRLPRGATSTLALCVLAALSIAGCGGDTSTDTQETSSPAARPAEDPDEATSSSNYADTTDELAEEDSDEADITYLIALDEPVEVGWAFRDIPEAWEASTAEGEVLQWIVTDACFVSIEETSGDDVDTPDAAEVLASQVRGLEDSTGRTIETGTITTRDFPYISDPVTEEDTAEVTLLPYEGADGVQGELYAYRNGEFGLLLSTGCIDGTFSDVDSDQFQPFISDEVAIRESF